MAQSPNGQSGNQSSVAPSSDLGANEWLVEEMKEQYDTDPGSVGPEWACLLRQRQRRTGQAAPSAPCTPLRAAQPDPDPDQAPATSAGSGRHPQAPAKAARRLPPRPRRLPSHRPRPRPPRRRRARRPPPTSRPKGTTHPGRQGPQARRARPPPSDEPTYTVLRGAPARTAENMDALAAVPTATSVRSVPVKLLWDNRTVINNHLARARGGKVSFTHLIGYALVKALRSMPEMNVGFEVVDGKPNLITPAHINLGLAIDMQKPDGTRQLLVPDIKGAEAMDFAAFWTAYEDMVRKAARQQADRRRLPGHHDRRLTNPGGIGTVHSVPRLMAGPGRDHRRRRDGVPAGVAGRLRGGDQPQRHQQVDDADLDLRPPRHPGRAVGRVPRARARPAARRERLLRRDLPLAADPLRADPLGPRRGRQPRRRHRQAGPHPRADPRLPRPRPPDGRHRPAGVPPAQPPRPRGRVARPDPVGPRPRVRDRVVRRRGPPLHEAAQHPRDPARLLLPHHRHRVHAHHGSRPAQVDPGARRAAAREAAPRGAAADPAQAQPGRGVRDLPADQVRRPEALQPRGRRDHHPAGRRDLRGGRRDRPRRGHASAWPTAVGSTCSPTSWARSTARSSASSRATSTRARSRAPAT